MPDITLDDIRNKPKMLDQYNDEEKSFINEHKDELNDEEKWSFQDFLVKEEPVATDEATTTPAEPETPVTPVTPETTPAEPFVFKTPEEAQAFVQKQIEEREKAAQANQPSQPAQPVAPALPANMFDPQWIPQNANEFAFAMANNPAFATMVSQNLAPLIKEQLNKETQQELETRQQWNDTWDTEYTDLAKAGKVPSLDTPEGEEANKQIALVAATYLPEDRQSYKEAYDLWAKLPTEFGGGFTVEAPQKPSMAAQKQAASRVGGGGGDKPTGKTAPYTQEEFKTLDLDRLLERAQA